MQVPLFQGGSYLSSSPRWSADRTLNLFPEVGESGATRSKMRLRGTPGLSWFCQLPYGPVRGFWANEYRLFAASGSYLYEIFPNASYAYLGNIGNDASNSPVQMFANGTQLFIVSAGNCYIHTGVNLIQCVLAQIRGTIKTVSYTAYTRRDREDVYRPMEGVSSGTTVQWTGGDLFDPAMVGGTIKINGQTKHVLWVSDNREFLVVQETDLGSLVDAPYEADIPVKAKTGAFIDGYFVAAPESHKYFYISDLYNGLTWDPLDFAVKEGWPDNIACVLTDHGDLWLMGRETIEVWRNTGNPDFPFERFLPGFIQQGVVAPFSAVRFADGVAWLGGDTRGRLSAWLARGYQPVRISTHAIEEQWASYQAPEIAEAFTYRYEGHEFWQITFPYDEKTWVFDANTKLWHERSSRAEDNSQKRHRARCCASVWGKIFAGDWYNGAIYKMTGSAYTDNGTPILRMRQAPHMLDEMKNHFYSRLQLDVETGVQVSSPEFNLSWSDDGGYTFRPPITATGGDLNEYAKRVVWRRLGKSRDRVFRISSEAPIPHVWIDAYVDVLPGNS